MINAEVLAALGPDGILINMARAAPVVDDPALIETLRQKARHGGRPRAFTPRRPKCRRSCRTMDNVVLFPHLGSASVHTREKMDQLVVDNILAWAAGKPPLTPVPETPFRSWSKD